MVHSPYLAPSQPPVLLMGLGPRCSGLMLRDPFHVLIRGTKRRCWDARSARRVWPSLWHPAPSCYANNALFPEQPGPRSEAGLCGRLLSLACGRGAIRSIAGSLPAPSVGVLYPPASHFGAESLNIGNIEFLLRRQH